MKAIQLNDYDAIDGLKLVDAPDPTPGPGEVLVRMAAASVNAIDWKVLDGSIKEQIPLTFPYTPGHDGAGVVESGGGAEMPPGTRVAICLPGPGEGTYAEQCAIPAQNVAVIPPGVDDRAAAALMLVALTAWDGLRHHAKIRPGERVLVLGASGGVGQAAVQIAVDAGCHVVGVASGKTEQMVRDLGAEAFVDYKTDDLKRIDEVDVIFDAAGKPNLADAVSRLRRGGRVVSAAQPVGDDLLATRGATGGWFFCKFDRGDMVALLAMAGDGKLKVSIDAAMPLADAADALRKNKEGRTTGKVLLIP